jgi:hypothetical protein
MKKQPAKKAAPTKKAAKKQAPRKAPTVKPVNPLGGSVSTTTNMVKAEGRSTVPDQAILLMSDAEYGAQVIDKLKEKLPPDKVAEIFTDLVECATYENKFGEEKTDYKTRLAALEKFTHMVVGKPLERIQNVQTTTYTHEELESLIAHSRELCMALREMLRPFDADDGLAK